MPHSGLAQGWKRSRGGVSGDTGPKSRFVIKAVGPRVVLLHTLSGGELEAAQAWGPGALGRAAVLCCAVFLVIFSLLSSPHLLGGCCPRRQDQRIKIKTTLGHVGQVKCKLRGPKCTGRSLGAPWERRGPHSRPALLATLPLLIAVGKRCCWAWSGIKARSSLTCRREQVNNWEP